MRKIFKCMSIACLCNLLLDRVCAENEQIEVCITYYWPGSHGQQGNITSTGKPAIHLKTCAVDPKKFPYGSKIHLHEMGLTLIANDTGVWVVRRVAAKKAGKNVPVIDIFVNSKSEANKLIKKYPRFIKVTYEPKKK